MPSYLLIQTNPVVSNQLEHLEGCELKREDINRAVTYVLVSVHAGEVQRRVAVVVLSLRVGLVVQQQQLDNRNKGRTTFFVTGVSICLLFVFILMTSLFG